MSSEFKREIEKKFRRFSFNDFQRMLYSYDLSEPPKILKRFIGIADVVIQPESKEEVYEILKLARKYKKPVIPRGAATSAYGGVLPYKGGMVVDFTRLNSFYVDEDKKLLISQAGVVWWDAQRELVKKGLSLRVYPTSAPSSTVGGWIGQGGYGIGSLKYGSIANNVDWVEVADFNGIKIRDPSKFVGLEGTTGFIVSAAIKLKDYKEDVAIALKADVEDAVRFVYNSKAHTAIFYSKKYVELLNSVMNFDIDKEVLLLAFECDVEGDRNLGEKLWEERFYPFRIRKVSNLVCVEVILPLKELIGFTKKILDIPFTISFAKQNAVVLIFLPVEKMSYGIWLKVMKLIKVAEKYGGKVYSSGLWFSYKSDKIFPNFEVLRNYKKEVDEYNLLNPGKVFPVGIVPRLIKIADKVVRC